MKRASLSLRALACLLAFVSPAAFAQLEGHDMSQTPEMAGMLGMSAEEHARMMQQAPPPSPALPPP